MIDATIMRLTARQLLGQKRTLLMLGFASLPLFITIIYRLAGDDDSDPQRWAARIALSQMVVGLLLPFTALVFGTAALGQEFEDGTAVYLLSKPIPRATIVASKLMVAWLATAAVVLLSAIPTGLVALSGEPPAGIVLGFTVACVVGAFVYCAAFLWLSIFTSRALIAGLVYVFVWEQIVTGLFRGVRLLSIREYTLGIAGAMINAPKFVFDPRLNGAQAVILAAIASVVATWLAIRALRRWEIGEAT